MASAIYYNATEPRIGDRMDSEKETAMNIHFEPLSMTEALSHQIAGWYNDPEIAPFIRPTYTETEPTRYTADEVLMQTNPKSKMQAYVIMDEDKIIGEVSITKDFHWLLGSKENCAWVSICIGERAYWGKGIAKLAMTYLETECRRQGYTRIELGVFENNLKAKALYEKMGYVHFATTKHMTYSQGAWRDDLRMEKHL